jgi:hypothetical protein
VATLSVVGCSESTTVAPSSSSQAPASTTPGGRDDDTAPGGTGRLTIHITDSPFSDAKAVLITFSEVSVHKADPGNWLTLPFVAGTSRTCDLKKLQGPIDVLGVGSLAAGKYTQIRLHVSNAAIYFDAPSAGPACAPSIPTPSGTFADLTISSGEVKLNHQFTVVTTGTTVTLDFDGDQSIHQTGGGNGKSPGGNGKPPAKDNTKYMMSPVVRVVSVQ